MKKYFITAAVVIALAACGQGSSITEDDSKRLNENVNSSTAKSASPTVDDILAKDGIITAGDWEIGPKNNIPGGVIVSGTYVVTTPEDGINCYWSTVKDWDKELDSIIANGNIDPGKTVRVVVKKNYAGLSLDGDCLAMKKK